MKKKSVLEEEENFPVQLDCRVQSPADPSCNLDCFQPVWVAHPTPRASPPQLPLHLLELSKFNPLGLLLPSFSPQNPLQDHPLWVYTRRLSTFPFSLILICHMLSLLHVLCHRAAEESAAGQDSESLSRYFRPQISPGITLATRKTEHTPTISQMCVCVDACVCVCVCARTLTGIRSENKKKV